MFQNLAYSFDTATRIQNAFDEVFGCEKHTCTQTRTTNKHNNHNTTNQTQTRTICDLRQHCVQSGNFFSCGAICFLLACRRRLSRARRAVLLCFLRLADLLSFSRNGSRCCRSNCGSHTRKHNIRSEHNPHTATGW